MPTKTRLGGRPPRYSFVMNPFEQTRLSRCCLCEKLTYPRKFPLLIQIEGFGFIILGLANKYCSKCETIFCQQHDLDHQLVQSLIDRAPQAIGNEYVMIGTVDRKVWKQGLTDPNTLGQTFAATADFKKFSFLDVDPGGWRRDDADPAKYMLSGEEEQARRKTLWTQYKAQMSGAPVQKDSTPKKTGLTFVR